MKTTKKVIKKEHKPVVETLINTAAIALSAYGITNITTGHYAGYLAILMGMGLEFGKYWGRDKLWS